MYDEKSPVTRVTMMPRDTDGQGQIFAGVLLSHIDVAGSLVAYGGDSVGVKYILVTRAMDQVEFKEPVLVDDVISIYGSTVRIGRTSITVHLDVEADRNGVVIPVTGANLTYVAVGRDGKPVVIGNAEAAPVSSAPESARPAQEPIEDGERVLALRKMMTFDEANGNGLSIFGGALLSHMDLAAAYSAKHHCTNNKVVRCATRFMDSIEFKQAVHVGDVISCFGTVVREGTTSVTVRVDVEADRQGQILPVTCARVVLVALDKKGRSVPVANTVSKLAGWRRLLPRLHSA